MDYIYQGEVQLLQDDLDSFLDIANKLKIGGLYGAETENIENTVKQENLKIASQKEDSEDSEAKTNCQMRKHAEIHIEGLSFPYSFCDKIFRSRVALCNHKQSQHKN